MPLAPTDPMLHSFAYSIDYLHEQVADIPDDKMAAQPSGLVNHPAWTIGHLTFACELIAGAISKGRVGPWLPAGFTGRVRTGTTPIPDVAAYEPKQQALARLCDARDRLIKAVLALSDAELAAPFPDPMIGEYFPSVRHALAHILSAHTGYHLGQVAAWRKAMGLGPLARRYE